MDHWVDAMAWMAMQCNGLYVRQCNGLDGCKAMRWIGCKVLNEMVWMLFARID